MRVLVTGGCGFIGSHLVEHHLAKDDDVRVIDNLTTGSLKNIAPFQQNPKFQFIEANILTAPQEIEESVRWAERIYHMAAVLGVYRVLAEPISVLTTNISGCEQILRAVANVNPKVRIIIASSSSVYGNSPKPLLTEKDSLIISPNTHPLWGYAVSKIADEALASAYWEAHKLALTPVRIFNTIGPRQTGRYGMVVPRFVQQACLGEPLTVYGDGTQTRSFCDVRDTIAALDIIAEKNISICEPINVGRDVEITINELADLVRMRAKSQSDIKYVPYLDAYGKAFNDIKQRRPDLTKLYSLTHFKHHWTLEKTVDDLIALYRTEKKEESVEMK